MKGRPISDRQLPGSSLRTGECVHSCRRYTRKMFDYDTDFGGSDSVVKTHLSCVCNEVLALKNRHQLDDGARYTFKGDLTKWVRRRVKPMTPWSEDMVIEHAIPSKKKLLMSAKESLKQYPLTEKDAAIKMFLKDDKYHGEMKDPRCIQYRNKRYNLRLGTYLHPLEEYVMSWTHRGTHIFAKGRNMRQRGRDIAAKFNGIEDCVVLSIDHSKFDCHVNRQLLEAEHWFYNQCFGSEELAFLLQLQIRNKGTTKNGTRYTTINTRMSGDKNTGLGNSLINYMMIKQVLMELAIKHNYYIDGDDSNVFVQRRFAHLVKAELFSRFGMVTKIENVADVIEHIDFCQCRPVFDGSGYTMVRNPERMLARLPWVVGPIEESRALDITYATGQCEIAQGLGLPIGQYIGQRMCELGGKMVRLRHRAWLEKMKPGKLQPIEPAAGVRESYALAWGLSVADQLAIEQTRLVQPEELYTPGTLEWL
ncbi:hypothetical protein 2 [Wenzhou tombus-like virus 11]|uniref:hypothetical protein 2 n=1 Tax=Wenzhou tombus-like virus 11 TaxID=1923664 RepID=UPI00090A0E30|nr:hypothetical protein 2 [Wenzhou tombus-like virus 11]APG76314.1 hypothetical protein 2 [Wenzhou tombus-like virus 11]